jgi:signal transduction histidine kinase
VSAPDLAALARPVRHEANNLLAALGGTLDLARRSTTDERGLARIARMSEAATRLEALLKAYLALAAPAPPDPAGTDAPQVMALLRPLLALLLGPGRRVEIEAPARPCRTALPPAALQAIILDLTRRAAAAVPPMGGLRLVVEAAPGGLALRADPMPPAGASPQGAEAPALPDAPPPVFLPGAA